LIFALGEAFGLFGLLGGGVGRGCLSGVFGHECV
jgi:hypothetical protein